LPDGRLRDATVVRANGDEYGMTFKVPEQREALAA
jgi:hypothetical protein